ncbi:lia operon protein LiaI [Cytobacillus horneckiae]|uniref:Flagellar basal body rod protein n=1 Tax=Cytobacillus horneckiae TaxID=549687 RepID=A0A2N0ZEF6_9BACI|nr:flagellar basal body rod protein [Cytobacillus horneckiae]NRG45000.1 flagellar basal body rod protein [Bacillus sp. CRN 9]MBN6888143.1 flagellar basal body rod protein [Cytobacillus horneckiae]MCM3176997.1 flagellar basal body rod protein [Cytobacillus horneckiae]MEC1154696.1 flagellar basal body rod protein [Cytobacillus horneckiae]MED2939037.1 flagellar basal body rod protein [Cytobacillus horneckiae]
MKKFGLILAGGIAAIIILANLGSLLALAISVAILYLVFKQFIKSGGWEKAAWGIVGAVLLIISIGNIPAIIAVAAAYVLYLVYKNWNKSKSNIIDEKQDPFANFEKQWSDITKN